MLADELGLHNPLNIHGVYMRTLGQSITCVSLPPIEGHDAPHGTHRNLPVAEQAPEAKLPRIRMALLHVIALLCGRNCQALLSAFSSFLRSTAPFLRTMDVGTHILVVRRVGGLLASLTLWLPPPSVSRSLASLLDSACMVCCWLRNAWGLFAPNDLLSVSAARPPNTQSCMRSAALGEAQW
jgi:hypothetical protein